MNAGIRRWPRRIANFAAALAILVLFAPVARAQSGDPAIWIDLNKVRGAQTSLLERQFAGLAEQRNAANVYVIGLAGWSAQDVFIKELDGGIASLAKVLPVAPGHVVRLINNVKTLETVPVANPDNFTAAVQAVGRAMDKDNDILVLFMTSHGTQNGVALKLGRAMAELSPGDVAEALTQAQIKNRLVIVSACYSGVYMKPLANENSVVLTAADSNNPSFGCSAKRSWTYFGDAFFNRSLRPGTDLKKAFANARVLIQQWENTERLKPSNPQAHFGAAIAPKLDALGKTAPQQRS